MSIGQHYLADWISDYLMSSTQVGLDLFEMGFSKEADISNYIFSDGKPECSVGRLNIHSKARMPMAIDRVDVKIISVREFMIEMIRVITSNGSLKEWRSQYILQKILVFTDAQGIKDKLGTQNELKKIIRARDFTLFISRIEEERVMKDATRTI